MPNDPNPDGITPFEHARENDFEEIKAILIPFLANVDENDIDELPRNLGWHDTGWRYCDIIFQDYISLNGHVENAHMPKM